VGAFERIEGMTLVAPAVAPQAKGLPVATSHTAPKAAATPLTEAPRSSTGEISAANIKPETSRAIDAAGQSAVTPSLRDQETAERSNRLSARRDAPTGPPPAFDESLLEQRARTALDPPEFAERAKSQPREIQTNENSRSAQIDFQILEPTASAVTTQAEEGFAETLVLSEPSKSTELDIRG
jgi:hypothetical protein